MTPLFHSTGAPKLLIVAGGDNARSLGLLRFTQLLDKWRAAGERCGFAGWIWNAFRKGGRGAPVRLDQFPDDEQWIPAFIRANATEHDIAYIGCMVDARNDTMTGSRPLQTQRGSPTMTEDREAFRAEVRKWRGAGVFGVGVDWLALDGPMNQNRKNAFSIDHMRSDGKDILPECRDMDRRDSHQFIRGACALLGMTLYTEPADGKDELQIAASVKWKHDPDIAEAVMRRGDVLWIDSSDTSDMIEAMNAKEVTLAINGNQLTDEIAEVIGDVLRGAVTT